MLRGFLSWCALVRVRSRNFKGMAEVIGLGLLLKGVSKEVFQFMVSIGVSCSYDTCIRILMRQSNELFKVRYQITGYTYPDIIMLI